MALDPATEKLVNGEAQDTDGRTIVVGPEGVPIGGPGGGSGTEYDDGDIDLTPTGRLIMWQDTGTGAVLAVTNDDPLPVSVLDSVRVQNTIGGSLNVNGEEAEGTPNSQSVLTVGGQDNAGDVKMLEFDASGQLKVVTPPGGAGLTDAELRASPVSVEQATSVDVADGGGSLTVDSTQLPAALDGVSLKVKEQSPLSQGLTDAQLRAAVVPTQDSRLPAALDADGGVKVHTQNPLTQGLTDAQFTAQKPFPVTDNAGSLTVDAPVGTPVWVRLSDGAAAFVGQKAMAASIPVTIASDQATFPVTTGGLTDAQLRASAVPVSNTVLSVVGAGAEAAAQRVTLSTEALAALETITADQGTLKADNAPATDTLNALNDTAVFAVPQGYRGVQIQFEGNVGAGSATVSFQASLDGGVSYFTIPMQPLTGMELPPMTSVTSAQMIFNLKQFTVSVEGFTHIRMNMTAFVAAFTVDVRARFTRETAAIMPTHWVIPNAPTGEATALASGENPMLQGGYDYTNSLKRRIGVLAPRTVAGSTQPSTTMIELPTRLLTYQAVTGLVAPPITIGIKELLAFFSPAAVTQDVYIVEISASFLVTTASTVAGTTTVEALKITTAGTGGTNVAAADIGGGLGTSAVQTNSAANIMQVKTGGGAAGVVFSRQHVEYATSPIGTLQKIPIFTASTVGNGIILRGGSNDGISVQVNRVAAHTSLVDSWTAQVRWIEL